MNIYSYDAREGTFFLDQLNMYIQKQIKHMMELRSLYIVSYDW